jgi:small-conductance mechanosensitive channel
VLPALGIDLTALSVFSGALGVGIGFGLQKIASNYVSGFIILFDRSVKIGDVITVDNRTGQLTQMTARYVVVRSLDGTEAIIPNDTLITSTVVNQSYTERLVAVPVETLVDYASDVELALNIMRDVAKAHPRVRAKPEPAAFIKSFADNGIHLHLGVWIDDPEKGHGSLCSDLYLSILREFKAREIRIPRPQREVRVVEGRPPAATA